MLWNIENGTHNDESITLNVGGKAKTNTYFNSFSIRKWKKYSVVDDYYFEVKTDGEAIVSVFGVYDDGREEELIKDARSNELIAIPETDASLLYVLIEAPSEKVIIHSGSYCTKQYVPEIQIATVICTYKRYEPLCDNVAEIEKSKRRNYVTTYIVDNASDEKTLQLSSDRVVIIPEKGIGSAGGFSRGIEEALTNEKNQYIVLMDDDAAIRGQIIDRLYDFLRCISNSYTDAIVGGALLSLFDRSFQYESGALWNGGDVIRRKPDVDLIDFSNVIKNEIEEKTEYMGWWLCCVPRRNVLEKGLPLKELYFHRDDIEYGLRNPKQITLNGICTWHAPMNAKVNLVNEYYDIRNLLIVNAIYEDTPIRNSIRFVTKRLLVHILRYDYYRAELLCDGVSDFVRGKKATLEHNSDEYYQKLLNKEKQDVDYIRKAHEKEQVLYSKEYVDAFEPSYKEFRRTKMYWFNKYDNSLFGTERDRYKDIQFLIKAGIQIIRISLRYTVVAKEWKHNGGNL